MRPRPLPQSERSPDLPPGAVLFARYAYPPNALGFCGPDDADGLLGAAAEGTDVGHLRALATGFEGAWPYLELIAGANGIADPLDARVVDAYWVGNRLLARVPPSALAGQLDVRFARRAGPDLTALVAPAGSGAVAQHSFHVFAVSPWLGLLRQGTGGPAPLEVLDRCRIRWGTVEAISGDHAVVRSRPLELAGSRLVPGPSRTEPVRCGVGGTTLVVGLAVGDVVSCHWDWVCDRLSADALGRLRRATARNLAAVNAVPVPGHAVAAG